MKNIIKCPICDNELTPNDTNFTCNRKHSFDKSKTGYINLSKHSLKDQGDNNELVLSRNTFLSNNYYHELKLLLNSIINKYKHNNILDLACGTGYYTNSYDLNSNTYGIDLSKKAITLASKKSNNQFIIGSIFDLPFFDNSFDVISLIFAPRPIDEIYRTLKLNAVFIEVTPNVNHLIELKKALYDNVILNDVHTLQDCRFKLVYNCTCEFKMNLDNEMVKHLFNMTPYKYKTSVNSISKLDNIDQLDVTADFIINVYKKII